MDSQPQFGPGDIVHLLIGGPALIVLRAEKFGARPWQYRVAWFDQGDRLQEATLPGSVMKAHTDEDEEEGEGEEWRESLK